MMEDFPIPSTCSSELRMDTDENPMTNTTFRENILDDVACSDGFFKSQQRGESDLTILEKRKIAETLLNKNCVLFLERYWRFINVRDIPYFDGSDYEVQYYLGEIKKFNDKKKRLARIKNRRYEAMKKMMNEGSYFSENEMRSRNPHLYEHLIGQYLTDDERSAILKDKQRDFSFSGFLMAQIDRNCTESLLKMQEHEESVIEENDDDTEDDNEEDEEEIYTSTEARQKVSECERQMLRSEFTNIMYESFLTGKDEDFDYSSVDNNAEYDSVRQREIDEEEKYFDDDSTERVID